MGKTKAEERAALVKIGRILEDFSPEDTYIGKAFEGCVEQAEENICNDWMLSFRSRYEGRDRDVARLKEKLTEASTKLCESEEARVDLTEALNQKDDAIARLEDAKKQLSEEINRLIRTLDHKNAAYTDMEGRLEEAKEEADALRQTILELKAKLYDMMTREEVKE